MVVEIAQVLSKSTGGIGRHVGSVLPRLVERGFRVRLFCPKESLETVGLDQRLRGEIAWRPLSSLRQARTADVIHAHGYKAAALAGVACWPGPPLVVSWHNAVLPLREAQQELITGSSAGLVQPSGDRERVPSGREWAVWAGATLLQRWVARHSRLILGASSDLVELAREQGADDARLMPVAAVRLPAPRRSRGELRAELGVAAEQKMILTVTRLAPQKNLGLLIAMAAELRQRSDLLFVIAGEGPEQESLAVAAVGQGLPIEFLGRRDDVADLLNAADCALLTSRWEARALFAQEALSAGVPLVATRVGGIEELVGDAALLIDVTSPPAQAADALARLLDDEVALARLRRSGPQRAADWPDEEGVVDQLADCYRELAPDGRADV